MASEKVVHLTEQDFDTKIAKGLTLVDFWAEWCGPCHALSPTLEELAAEHAGSVKVGKLDVDANPLTAQAFGVRSIPTVVLFRDGEAVEQIIGVRPKSTYVEAIGRLGNGN
jgi:thioredoxin 1